jgi:thiol-disulfide isomerase/thioredoxin
MLVGFLFLDRCAPRRESLGPVPDVGLETLLGSPGGSLGSMRELAGKAVVLEFWATWCGSCRDSIPHMNKLREVFRKSPVVFLSVTREPREVVEGFLRGHPMTGWIGLDEDARLHRAFGVRGVPEVFVIDRYGRITLKITPSFLYKSDIERALKAEPPKKSGGSQRRDD